jgi:citrate synthase
MLMKRAESQRYVTAPEAARLLGVKPATLYAYVSRGLLESVPAEHGRARRYRRADLERLRGEGRRAGASAALRWGEPVLDSAITAITQEGPV